MNIGDFYHTYCSNCGSQRCEGPRSDWFDGCEKRFELDEYVATHERVPTLHEILEEINKPEICEKARKLATQTSSELD